MAMNHATRVQVPIAGLLAVVWPGDAGLRLRVKEHACEPGDRLLLMDPFGGQFWFGVLDGTDDADLMLRPEMEP